MTLSDKINGYDPITRLVVRGDIKDFIKKLKDFQWTSMFIKERQQNMIEAYKLNEFFDMLDEIAGEDLK